MVDVKVKAGVVVIGKVVAVDKDKAVVDVTIVWVIGLLVDVVVVVIPKVVCSVLGFAVLDRSVVDPGTVECSVLVLGLIKVVEVVEVLSEVETVVLIKIVELIISEEL